MNTATIIVASIIAAVFIAIVVSAVIGRKKGESACGCQCSGCPMSGECHKNQ